MPPQRASRIGEQFGRKEVIALAGRDARSRPSWHWRCMVCGREGRAFLHNLKQPCMCERKTGVDSKRYKGCGQISGHEYTRIRCRAKRAGHAFECSIEYLWDLFLAQRERCSLSGRPLRFAVTTKEVREGVQTASLDRIDSRGGYTPDNVQWVHVDFQTMKWNRTQDEFIAMCKEVTEHQRESQSSQTTGHASAKAWRWHEDSL